jgi:hypothetical protein
LVPFLLDKQKKRNPGPGRSAWDVEQFDSLKRNITQYRVVNKKNKLKPSQLPAAKKNPSEPLFSRRGLMVLLAGVCAVAVGFFLVTLTDPAGQNWASNLCPFVILGGYALIGVGIVWRDDAALPAAQPPR